MMKDINGVAIHYETYGDASKSPMLLAHGLYSDLNSMMPFGKLFADEYFIIGMDAIGHGQSGKPAQFSLEDQGRAVLGLADALGYGKFIIIGESMGSYVGAQAAILGPEHIDKLVLLVPKAHGKTSSVEAFLKSRNLDATKMNMEELLAAMDEALWSPTTPLQRRAEIMAEFNPDESVRLTPEETKAVDASLQGFDLRDGLPSITCPTLVVSGKYDGLNPPERGKEVADLIPGSRFEVIQNAGHMLKSEKADVLVPLIRDFLTR
jgi:3-oxoadipate enol-lactonase